MDNSASLQVITASMAVLRVQRFGPRRARIREISIIQISDPEIFLIKVCKPATINSSDNCKA